MLPWGGVRAARWALAAGAMRHRAALVDRGATVVPWRWDIRPMSYWGRYKRSWKHFVEQVVAGPGVIARQEDVLFQADAEASHALWRVFSDSKIGGASSARVDEAGPTLIFSGELVDSGIVADPGVGEENVPDRLAKDADGQTIRPGGRFAGMAIDADHLAEFDLEPFTSLTLRLRGDGETYLLNLKPDNPFIRGFADTSVWQATFTATDEWQEIVFPFRSFTFVVSILPPHPPTHQPRRAWVLGACVVRVRARACVRACAAV